MLTTSVAQAGLLRPTIGQVEQLQYIAEARFGSDKRRLKQESHVYFEDTLKTGPGARMQARLLDGSALTLGENARIEVDEFVYQPWGDKGKLSLDVVSGAFLFVGGRVEDADDSEVEIATPVGTLGIRGTTVWGGQIDGGYGVLVLDGEVDVMTAGGSVTLKAGQGTMVWSAKQAPEQAGSWSDDRTARAVETISFR